MGKYRRGRINDAVAEELAIALGNVREPKVIDNFVSRLNNNGYSNVGLYGNLYMLTDGSLSFEHNYPVWVAQYNDTCQYDKEYIGWQYTSDGSIPGIEGRVDLNYFY